MGWREKSAFVEYNLLLILSENAEEFYGLILIFRNIDAIYLEYRTIEQMTFITLKCLRITFSKYLVIIELWHLSLNVLRRLSPPSGQNAAPPPTCRTE
jgi:hypothetical protein